MPTRKRRVPLPTVQPVCEQCPWRAANQGFHSKANLTRLWNQIRKGGLPQSCHLADASHPEHVANGTPENAKARECPGSVILVLREIRAMADDRGVVHEGAVERYLLSRPRGLTRGGIGYWLLSRYQWGSVPFVGGGPLPKVDEDHPDVALPENLTDGGFQ